MGRIISKLYGSRSYKSGDEIALINLYNLVTGRSRTLEEYSWEWLETTEGQGSIWIIEKKDDGQIVGHHGLIPIPFNYFGQSMVVGKTENTLIHPQHKGNVLYFLFEREFFEEAKERFDLLYTTMGAGTPGKIRLKLGYFPVSSYLKYTKISCKAGLDELVDRAVAPRIKSRWLAKLVALYLKLFNYLLVPLWVNRSPTLRRRVKLERITAIEPLLTALEELWMLSKGHYPITIDRNSRYLKWRIFDNPNVKYDFFAAFEADQLVGYVIVEHQLKQSQIVDLIVAKNDPTLFDALLQALTNLMKTEQVNRLQFSTLAGCTYLHRSLIRNGFYPLTNLKSRLNTIWKQSSPERSQLLIKAINPLLDCERLSQANNWYYTDIFTEGLFRG